jgi:hypothetical protein
VALTPRRRALLALAALILLGSGALLFLLLDRQIDALKPVPYPGATPIFDYQRCGEADFSLRRRGYHFTAFDCYLTDRSPGEVSSWYRKQGYRIESGGMARHRVEERPFPATLTQQVHATRQGGVTRIWLTTTWTTRWPTLSP